MRNAQANQLVLLKISENAEDFCLVEGNPLCHARECLIVEQYVGISIKVLHNKVMDERNHRYLTLEFFDTNRKNLRICEIWIVEENTCFS